MTLDLKAFTFIGTEPNLSVNKVLLKSPETRNNHFKKQLSEHQLREAFTQLVSTMPPIVS